MPSFDIVSDLCISAVRNAVENTQREVSTRWDFRGVDSAIEWKKDDKEIHLSSTSQMHVRQLLLILTTQLSKQGVAISALDIPEKEKLSGKQVHLVVGLKYGIPKELLQTLNQFVRKNFPKAQSQMQGEQLRVQGKSRDLLQNIIQDLKAESWERPLQFVNFKD